MELEALRKQLSEEIASQFDAKLREAKRQKSQIEEEFELSSEKWRTERRRLNSEIDRLEAALADARQSGRESSETRTETAVDPQEIIRLQAAADEKLRESSLAWEKERARLQAEISRLQESIAEFIERTNNPLRANPNERGKMELKYDDALRAKRNAEEALVRAKAEWEAEKLTLVAEAGKLHKSPAPSSVLRKVDDQSDKKLQEGERLRISLASDLEKARLEVSRLKEAHAAELQEFNARFAAAKTQWDAEKLNLENAAAKLRQAPAPSAAPRTDDEQLAKRLKEAESLRAGLAADLEKARQEIAKLKETHLSAKSQWEAEKLTLANENAKLRQAPAPAAAPRKDDEQTAKRLQESEKSRVGVAADLEKARHEIAKLKEAHSAELQDLTGRYIKTRSDLEKQVQDSEAARAKLQQDLEKAQQASASQDGTQSEEVTRLRNELDLATKENTELKNRLAAAKDQVSPDVVNDLQKQFDIRMQEILKENSQLSEKVKTAGAPAAGGSNGAVSTLDAATIEEEVKRVEELTAEIEKLIDNPDTELATVIRKNVERAGLESYLKGILFSLGRGKKL